MTVSISSKIQQMTYNSQERMKYEVSILSSEFDLCYAFVITELYDMFLFINLLLY